MTGPDPNPANEFEARPPRLQRRWALGLFALYLVLYAGFVLLNAFRPSLMEWTPLAGVNLAVLYGLGLIAAAFLLAVLYDLICRILEKRGESRR
jgi:uncharacterized membrane protein (DUF485 family)